MSAPKDPIGQKFGRLTVISFDHSNKDYVRYFNCRCDCGNEKLISRNALISGRTLSCGCLNRELSRLRKNHFTHGFTHKERLYETWKNMKRRCKDINNKRYSFYGGKGVVICKEWENDYLSFRNWAMSHGYDGKLTIDRIDNGGDYTPENCRWATGKEQQNNTSRNHWITCNGETHTVSEWADVFGVTYGAFLRRIKKGLNIDFVINLIAANYTP